MMILSAQGSLQPVRRAQSWAMERLIYVHVSGELRWAMLALALGSLRSAWIVGRAQFALPFCKRATQAPQHADTMVAAARS